MVAGLSRPQMLWHVLFAPVRHHPQSRIPANCSTQQLYINGATRCWAVTVFLLLQVCFIGPDIGPLKAVVVGPEEGAWMLDEVVVSSSAGARTQRFMCREHLGEKSSKGAAVLKAVPEGKVVYGSGDRATLISVVCAAAFLNLTHLPISPSTVLLGWHRCQRILHAAAQCTALQRT